MIGLVSLMGAGAIPELKAAAWSVASKVLLFRGDKSILQTAATVTHSLGAEELSRIEVALRLTESPSLELFVNMRDRQSEVLRTAMWLTSASLSRDLTSLHYEIRDTAQLVMWVFSQSSLDDALAVIQAIEPRRKKHTFGPDFLQEMTSIRLAINAGGFWFRHEPHVPLECACISLGMIGALISRRDLSCWGALQRLAWFKWSGESNRKVMRCLKDLCICLEKATMEIPGFPLAGLVARVAEIRGAERYLEWLLKIMLHTMPYEARLSHHRLREIRKTTITKIARTARGVGEIEGFARWFGWLDTSLRPRVDEGVEIPKLQVDKMEMTRLVETKTGDIRGGAIVILANTLSLTYDEARKLLRYAEYDAEVPDCWLELIEGTVKDADDSAAIGFLEDILSATGTYSKIARYAALRKYELIARSTTIDIVRQESRLGLPFQDVLRVGHEKTTASSR